MTCPICGGSGNPNPPRTDSDDQGCSDEEMVGKFTDWLRHNVSGREFGRIGVELNDSGDIDELRRRIDAIMQESRDVRAELSKYNAAPDQTSDMFGVSVVRVDGFRSQPTVNTSEDMVRVILDMPKFTWRKLKSIIPPNPETSGPGEADECESILADLTEVVQKIVYESGEPARRYWIPVSEIQTILNKYNAPHDGRRIRRTVDGIVGNYGGDDNG